MARKKMESKPDWETLKSGVLKNGNWYACAYQTGWYFYNEKGDQLGPFNTFEDGLKMWTQKSK